MNIRETVRKILLGIVLSASCGVVSAQIAITPNDPTSVQRGIEAAYKAGEKKVVVPAGVYRISPVAGSNWHLRFSDLKDFEIDATGATFVFLAGDKRGILLTNCEGVTFRGATLLREVPPFSQGKIVAIAGDRRSVDIQIDKGYPADLDDPRYFPHIPVIDLYVAGTRQLKPLVPDLYLKNVERLGDDLFRFHFRAAISTAIPMEMGDPAAWRGPSGNDFAIWESSRMRTEDITIENGTGLGFVELCGEGGNVYSHCIITYAPPPPGAVDQPLLACATDGFNSMSMRHGPTLEDCHFEGLDDDSVNIHGTYGMVAGVKDEQTGVIDWRTPHTGARFPVPLARPGDTLRFYDRKGALSSEGKVVSVKPLPDYVSGDLGTIESRVFSKRDKAVYFEVRLDKPVTAVPGGMAANPDQGGAGFVIRDCTFRNSRAHGLFIRADSGTITGCTIEGIMMGGIVVGPEMSSWNESDYVHGIVIRGNTIRNVGLGTQPWNGGVTVGAFEYGGFPPLPGGQRDIVIADNLFEDNRGPNLILSSAIGVQVENNRFVHPMTAPAFHIEPIGVTNQGALIWMRNVDQVSLKGNTVVAPGTYFKTLIDADASVTAEGMGDGIVVQP